MILDYTLNKSITDEIARRHEDLFEQDYYAPTYRWWRFVVMVRRMLLRNVTRYGHIGRKVHRVIDDDMLVVRKIWAREASVESRRDIGMN